MFETVHRDMFKHMSKTYTVLAFIAMAYLMAHVVVARTAMACMGTGCIVMAYIGVAYRCVAYTGVTHAVMAVQPICTTVPQHWDLCSPQH